MQFIHIEVHLQNLNKKAHMLSIIFSLTGPFLFRETSFQQVLLSSSGPKENIFISKFHIPLRCIRKCCSK